MGSFNPMKIRVIIGLGNPEANYRNTYHNVGQQFVRFFEEKMRKGSRPDITLLSSPTYMNTSGRYVANALRELGAPPEELLIVHDDSDLSLGSYKLSFGRGAAGHHGVQSIMASLGTKNFWRLRIGVRRASEGVRRKKAGEFVLSKITPKERTIFQRVFRDSSIKIEVSRA